MGTQEIETPIKVFGLHIYTNINYCGVHMNMSDECVVVIVLVVQKLILKMNFLLSWRNYWSGRSEGR